MVTVDLIWLCASVAAPSCRRLCGVRCKRCWLDSTRGLRDRTVGFFLDRRRLVKDMAWSRVLSVGVEEIDEDHRKLVAIFNILNHAVIDRESPEYMAAVLDELINCTVWHFSHEERLMLKHRYAASEEHKAEHRDLINSAKELQQGILQADRPVGEEHIGFLERWLTEHILTADMRLGAHLSQVM